MNARQMKIIDGASTAAIYTRKSRATEMGESIENQISRCISLCDYKGWGYVVYVDYDFSGKDTDRPDFFEMMRKIKDNKFNNVVVYHIYRFARNMADFTILMREFQDLEVGFTSISQDFDTSTPTGRAAMYMTAVFGQLGREDTAMQVRDNMIYLAEKGRWNGGPIPFGFDTRTELINYRNDEGKKKVTYLEINQEESEVIKEFYECYLAPGGSVRSVTTRANELGYKTKNNALWADNQVSRILQNPLYCIADENSYNYFKNNTEVNIVDDKEKYNGENGLMYYNRRRQYKKTSRLRDESEWILSIGEHKGFIPGEIFVNVQMKLSNNKSIPPRTNQGVRSPLVGLVKCARCKSSMAVFAGKKTSDLSKGYYYYFRCLTREQKARILCDNSNVRADLLEDLVVNHITGLLQNENSFKSILEATNENIEGSRAPLETRKRKISNELNDLDNELDNLVDALSKNILPELVIKRKYKDLESKKTELRKELEEINFELNNNDVEIYDLETVTRFIKDFKNTYEYLNFDEKKKLLHSIVKEVSMNRNKVKLTLYFLPGQEYGLQADCLRKDNLALAKHKTISIDCTLNDANELPESTLGERVRKLRITNNLTINQLASMSNVAEETISNIEKSRTIPNISTVNKLSQALSSNNKYLLSAEDWPESSSSEIIYKYRMISGLSQRDLAKRCNLHNSTIKDYEDGNLRNPDTLKNIYRIIGYI